jgi:predicted  nucleic acid-binding Zn-ribbon protein
MANIKYRKSDGTYGVITNYNVQPLVPVQETGESVIDVMSQKAVTDALQVLEDKIKDINPEISDVSNLATKEELKELNDIVTENTNNITNLNGEVTTFRDNTSDSISDIESNISTINTEIDGIKENMLTSSDIAELQDTKQNKEDNNLETNSKTIVGAINEVNNTISGLAKQSDLNDLSGKVITNTNNISTNTNSINDINTTLSTLAKQSDLNALTTKVNTNTSNITKNTNSINSINTTLSTLAKQSDLNALTTKVNTNTSNISTNTSNISSLTTKVNNNTSDITNLKNNKQNKSDNSLKTTTKTVVGGINELKTSLDNLDTELDKKQDKSDNSLKTTTKTVVGGINELDSKLKAEEFAGGLKVKLANNGTAIITNEGIRVLDSNNVEKIKLIDGDIDIDDAKKYTTTIVSPVADSTLKLPSDISNITTTYKDSKSINVSGNISKIQLSMYKDVSIRCTVGSTATAERSEDYEYIVKIGDYAVRTYEINISIPKNSKTATIKHRLKGETTWSTGGDFDIKCSDFISYNNFRVVSNYFNVVLNKVTPNTTAICTITVQIASQGGGRYCNVITYNMTNGMDKTLIGFNGFLTFHDFNNYFTAYTDANTQYRIIGRGDVVDIKKNS